MDKLLDFKKGKITGDYKMYRFQCDCLTASDAMDIDIENCNESGKYITIRMDFRCDSFWTRLKYAWRILNRHWTWREFIPREDDYDSLSNIFDKPYDELP